MSIEEHIQYTHNLAINKQIDKEELREEYFQNSNELGEVEKERFGLFSYVANVDQPIKHTKRK